MKQIMYSPLLLLVVTASAHMQMSNPPPFLSKYNPYTTTVDYSMSSPLLASGQNYPCKGYHSVLHTPQGAPVAAYQPGQTYNLTIVGGASHSGGSCQVSLSYDQGASWTVIHSYIGSCPLTPNWTFTIPADTPAGDALFAWSWFNKVGNREMYMNCAHVVIQPAAGVVGQNRPYNSFFGRPAIFVANVNNGCSTIGGTDVVFPNPGPDTDYLTQSPAAPVGNCH